MYTAPSLIKWYTAAITESSSHIYNRKTTFLRLLSAIVDTVCLVLTTELVSNIFSPGNNLGSSHIVAMTCSLVVLFVSSIVCSGILRTTKRSSLLQFTLDILGSIGVFVTLVPLLYSLSSFSTADDAVFRLLPSGAVKIFALALRLDTLMKFTSIRLFAYRACATLFCFSWILGNAFVILHQREDQCSSSVLWLHAVLLLLGGGASSEEVGCLITEHSSVAKVSVAALLVGLMHCLAYSVALTKITDGSQSSSQSRNLSQSHEKQNRTNKNQHAREAESFRCLVHTSPVNAKWIKRRKLVLVIYSPAKKLNEDEVTNDMNVMLERLLLHEERNAPGYAVSILWVGNDKTIALGEEYLRRLIKAKEHGEWINRVALHQSDGCGGGGAPNPSDLSIAGVQLASHVLIPTWCNDDTVSLYVTVVRSMSQEETIICCECDWPENKLVCLEAGANHVVCLKELQLNIMGRCVGAPGMADLITELCGQSEKNTSIGSTGIAGYNVVVPLQVPRQYRHMAFCEASYHMYNEYGLILFGMNAYIKEQEHFVLNPSHRQIVGSAICFCMASSSNLNQVHAAHTSTLDTENENKKKDNNDLEQKKEPPRTRPKSKDATQLLLSNDLLRPVDVSQIIRRPMRRGAPWKRPSRLLRASRRVQISGLSLLMRSDPSNAWRISEDTFDAGRPMWSVVGKNRGGGMNSTPDGGEDEEYVWHELDDAVQSGLQKHIVIVAVDTTTVHRVHHLVNAIRNEERQTWVPIVIVSVKPPSTDIQHGNDIGAEPGAAHSLPHVYWVPGDGRSREGLLRAGIMTASHVLVCPGSAKEGEEEHIKALAVQTRVIRLCQILAPHVELTASTPYAVFPNVSSSSWKSFVHQSESVDNSRNMENDMKIAKLKQLLPQFVTNPYIGAIVNSIVSGSHQEPPNIRDSDLQLNGAGESADRTVVFGSPITPNYLHSTSILSKLRENLRTKSLIRSSFVRVRGCPKYLIGQPFIKLFEFCVYSDGGSVPLGILRKDTSSGSTMKVRRHLRLNMKRDDLLVEDDLYFSVIPAQYQHLLKRKHRLQKAARDQTDSHYARQLHERTATLIREQLDVIVDIKTRMQQAYDSREAKMKRDQESHAFNPFQPTNPSTSVERPSASSEPSLARSNTTTTTTTTTTDSTTTRTVPKKTSDLLKVMRDNQPTTSLSGEENDNSLVENQDIATQVLSLLRSTTSLLSILIWRQQRVISLRGDQTIPGATALAESQNMYQQTCMSESLVEMMVERDARIREMIHIIQHVPAHDTKA